MNNKEKFEQIKNQFIHSIPVDVVGLANALGIEVYKDDFDNKQMSGYIAKEEDGYFICVNKKHPATRQQFTIAHEIGHFVLHQHLLENNSLLPTFYKIGNGIINSALPRCEQYYSHEYRKTETEANSFAASLLMPEVEFIAAANDCDNLNDLANKFKVSVGAASIRANNLEIEIF